MAGGEVGRRRVCRRRRINGKPKGRGWLENILTYAVEGHKKSNKLAFATDELEPHGSVFSLTNDLLCHRTESASPLQ